MFRVMRVPERASISPLLWHRYYLLGPKESRDFVALWGISLNAKLPRRMLAPLAPEEEAMVEYCVFHTEQESARLARILAAGTEFVTALNALGHAARGVGVMPADKQIWDFQEPRRLLTAIHNHRHTLLPVPPPATPGAIQEFHEAWREVLVAGEKLTRAENAFFAHS